MSNPITNDNTVNRSQFDANAFPVVMLITIIKYPRMKQNVFVPKGTNGNTLFPSPNFNILYLLILSVNVLSSAPISFCIILLIGGILDNMLVTKEDINIPKNTRNPEKSFPKNEDIMKYETSMNGNIL